jgi:hypothetical protein
LGDVQAEYAAPSREHSDVPASLDVNSKLAAVAVVVPDGPAVIVVSGAIVSTVQVRVAGVGSMFPAGSFERTSKVWRPSASPEYAAGETHTANAAPSSAHSKTDPASSDENAKVAESRFTVPEGPEPSVVSGGSVSAGGGGGGSGSAIVHVRAAGEVSVFPTASVARTSKVWLPAACEP